MIPLHDIDKPHTYAYVAGCRNVVWLAGKIKEIQEENKVLMISRTEDDLLPIELEPSDRIPEVKVGESIKLICHIYSGVGGQDEQDAKAAQHIRLVAKYIGRPTLLDMKPVTDFSKLDINDANAFDSFDLPEVLTPVSNRLEAAGFVDGAPVLAHDGESRRDRFVFMLRQAPGAQFMLPVEIAGKHAAAYRKAVRIGSAVFVHGIILSRKREDGRYVAVLRSDHVTKARPEHDFTFESVPGWVAEIRERLRNQIEQEMARRAAAAAAAAMAAF